MRISKPDMMKSLPVSRAQLTIRHWNRRDLNEMAKWPGYPFPYESFNIIFGGMSTEERDEYFRSREADENKIALVMDHPAQTAIGYLVLVDIDWQAASIEKMAIRVCPSWCDKGFGTRLLRAVSRWCFENGIKSLRLDVAASNSRAIRCYQKAGFAKTGEFWRGDEQLKMIDLNEERYDFLRPHVRIDGGAMVLRFWWMELRNSSG